MGSLGHKTLNPAENNTVLYGAAQPAHTGSLSFFTWQWGPSRGRQDVLQMRLTMWEAAHRMRTRRASPKDPRAPWGTAGNVQNCCPGNTSAAGMALGSSSCSWLSSTPAGCRREPGLREGSEHIFQGVKPQLGLCLSMDYGKCTELTVLVQGLNPHAPGSQPWGWTQRTGQGLYLLPSSSDFQLLGWRRLLVCPTCCVLSAGSEPTPG